MTELEAHTRADQIVQHHLSDPLELRSFVARCLLADAHIAAQDATIALLRAECNAWRKLVVSVPVTIENFTLRDEINASRAAVDSAHALEENK